MQKKHEQLLAKRAKLQNELIQVEDEITKRVWICGAREKGHRYVYDAHADYQECVDCGATIIVCQHCKKLPRGMAEEIRGGKFANIKVVKK